jgi:putative ABC transport system permease protein
MKTTVGLLTSLLAGIASISLLVGGIGIMNMMLVSVTERTTEIGLRKALGAEPKRIQIQFLAEAIFLSLIGGVSGVILGVLISWIAASMMGVEFALSVGAILLGVGFSAAVGIIFGWAPARTASKLNPIDALRST